MKLVVFDFCETIVKVQSHDLFVKYYLKHEKKYIKFLKFLLLKTIFAKILIKLFSINSKKIILSFLQNESRLKIITYSKKFSKHLSKKANKEVIEILKSHAQNNMNKCLIISAGLTINIEDFLDELNIKNVTILANDLEYKNNKFTGKYLEPDCYGDKKVSRFYKLYPNETIDYFYTDCHSDKPLIDISKHSYLIKDNNKIIEL